MAVNRWAPKRECRKQTITQTQYGINASSPCTSEGIRLSYEIWPVPLILSQHAVGHALSEQGALVAGSHGNVPDCGVESLVTQPTCFAFQLSMLAHRQSASHFIQIAPHNRADLEPSQNV